MTEEQLRQIEALVEAADKCEMEVGRINEHTIPAGQAYSIRRVTGPIVAWVNIPAHGCKTEVAGNCALVAHAFTTIPALLAEVRRLREQKVWLPLEYWREDMGPAFWTRFPVDEPYYAGCPVDDNWPGYHTHFVLMDVLDTTPPQENGEMKNDK